MKVTKKPIEVDALQFDGTNESCQSISAEYGTEFYFVPDKTGAGAIVIPALEGEMTARKGDWVVRGIQGEFYPIKDDIFRESYDFTEF